MCNWQEPLKSGLSTTCGEMYESKWNEFWAEKFTKGDPRYEAPSHSESKGKSKPVRNKYGLSVYCLFLQDR